MSEIKVPELGESIAEGTIFKWLVKEGDTVQQGDVLAELETDKVNLEVSAEQSGTITKIVKGEGENVVVGEVIGTIEEGDVAAPAEAPAASSAPAAAEEPSQEE
ncbi:biotin/lipoyl-containing protein, partial [Paenibacillus senegalensis]|uniref:biotin/lipoyl-containing protein n=1 Tax=Paenibacillus senegalensis TaxID=1465766 RepID=UPI000287F489